MSASSRHPPEGRSAAKGKSACRRARRRYKGDDAGDSGRAAEGQHGISTDSPRLPPGQVPLDESVALLDALKSLYKDGLEPSDHHVSRRLEELTGERWDYPKIRLVAKGSLGVEVAQKPSDRQRFWLYLQNEGADFIDLNSLEDKYPVTLWRELQNIIDNCHPSWLSQGIATSRYDCALKLREEMSSLKRYRLGDVCHIVQLAVRRFHVLGYRAGWIVPYKSSQDYEKFLAAQHLENLHGVTGEDRCTVTWDDLQRALPEMIEQSGGRLALSMVKALFRERMRVELSETALGHTQLSAVFRDPRLADCCALESNGCEPMLRPVERRIPVAPPLKLQLELANYCMPPPGSAQGSARPSQTQQAYDRRRVGNPAQDPQQSPGLESAPHIMAATASRASARSSSGGAATSSAGACAAAAQRFEHNARKSVPTGAILPASDPRCSERSQEDADGRSDSDSGPCFEDLDTLAELRRHLDESEVDRRPVEQSEAPRQENFFLSVANAEPFVPYAMSAGPGGHSRSLDADPEVSQQRYVQRVMKNLLRNP